MKIPMRWIWVGAGIVVASVVDLVWMFWSRSQTGNMMNKAGWHASGLGKGRYNLLPGKGGFKQW